MSRPLAVLRPAPGNAATLARIARHGLTAIRLPLFDVRACAWAAPDPTDFDVLLLTSANAIRHAGPALASLAVLPVLAVGAGTAKTAREAGLDVRLTGEAGASALMAQAQAIGIRRALHLAGRDRSDDLPGVVDVVTVYASEPVRPDPAAVRVLAGSVALLHSSRAAIRLAELVDEAGIDRASIRLAALSDAVAHAAGPGWDRVAVAPVPTDAAIVATGVVLAG